MTDRGLASRIYVGGTPRYSVRKPPDKRVQDDEEGHLQETGEASSERAGSVLLVEPHHLLVEHLPVLRALVLGLELLHLGLQSLHRQHRLGALHRDRRQGQHDDHRQAGDREAVVGPDGVEAGQDQAEELEKGMEDLPDQLEQGVLSEERVRQHDRVPSWACTRTGTRSTP